MGETQEYQPFQGEQRAERLKELQELLGPSFDSQKAESFLDLSHAEGVDEAIGELRAGLQGQETEDSKKAVRENWMQENML